MALIVAVTVSSYVPLTVCITERRGKARNPNGSARGPACCRALACVHVSALVACASGMRTGAQVCVRTGTGVHEHCTAACTRLNLV